MSEEEKSEEEEVEESCEVIYIDEGEYDDEDIYIDSNDDKRMEEILAKINNGATEVDLEAKNNINNTVICYYYYLY